MNGGKKKRRPNRPWTEREVALVRDLRLAGLGWVLIAARVDRGWSSVKHKMLGGNGQPRLLDLPRLGIETDIRAYLDLQPRSLSAALLGDPLPGRSALDLERKVAK